MKKPHNMHYIVFISLVIVGVNKAAAEEMDSPRTKTKKHLLKAYSYHDHGAAPRAGQAFPNLMVPQSATSESLVSIAESSETGEASSLTLSMSGSPRPSPKAIKVRPFRRDLSEDKLDEGFFGFNSLSPSRKNSGTMSTLAALRQQFPRGRTGLAAEAKGIASSQEQKGSSSTEGIQVES